ncbi:uncharacterized protein BP5553_09766 [Venustampulla echinocandica]|uniref:Uncharacterized protein n=1 Tax=Venustampulla echinocandica TaxID=2656787 RepID=A0A370TBZ9_9HELO|nr:uncharacterized protein BP5553_09766 [Venustampulla echinocandica]RDL31557.1 hypothetical protein BP5553_09766 [Venustampulla echinocandica]
MLSRVQSKITTAEERKRRKENFRKRSKSLRVSGNASVDLLGEPSNPHDIIVEPRESDNINAGPVGESNNIVLDVPESDIATFQLLGESDNLPGKAMAMDVDVDLVSAYDMMDLNIQVGIEVKGQESMELRSAGGPDTWQVVNSPRMIEPHDRQVCGPNLSTTVLDPTELLEGWDWVFQK